MTKRFRVGRTLIEEWLINGRAEVRVNGKAAPVSFHEAIIAAKQAPLLKMRDECRRMAGVAREIIEEGVADGTDDNPVD